MYIVTKAWLLLPLIMLPVFVRADGKCKNKELPPGYVPVAEFQSPECEGTDPFVANAWELKPVADGVVSCLKPDYATADATLLDYVVCNGVHSNRCPLKNDGTSNAFELRQPLSCVKSPKRDNRFFSFSDPFTSASGSQLFIIQAKVKPNGPRFQPSVWRMKRLASTSHQHPSAQDSPCRHRLTLSGDITVRIVFRQGTMTLTAGLFTAINNIDVTTASPRAIQVLHQSGILLRDCIQNNVVALQEWQTLTSWNSKRGLTGGSWFFARHFRTEYKADGLC
jgi:hypothetical protein